jgi:hypothetical protein
LPSDIQASPGSTVVVPVSIDTARPEGSNGMTNAVLALKYDPQVFDIAADDIQLGSLPSAGSGWQLRTAINAQTGEIGIDLFSVTPIQTTAGGSLVTITLHVRDTAPAGSTGLSIVSQVNPTGHRVYSTEAADTQGAFVLHPAVVEAGMPGGVNGEVQIGGVMTANELGSSLQGVVLSLADSTSMAIPVMTEVVQTATLASTISSTTTLGLVEKVFGGIDATVVVGEDTAIAQPAPLMLNSEAADVTAAGAHDMAGLVQAPLASAPWDDCLTQLAQTNVRHKAKLPSNQLDDLSALEETDLSGLEAFFAREGGDGSHGQSR